MTPTGCLCLHAMARREWRRDSAGVKRQVGQVEQVTIVHDGLIRGSIGVASWRWWGRTLICGRVGIRPDPRGLSRRHTLKVPVGAIGMVKMGWMVKMRRKVEMGWQCWSSGRVSQLAAPSCHIQGRSTGVTLPINV